MVVAPTVAHPLTNKSGLLSAYKMNSDHWLQRLLMNGTTATLSSEPPPHTRYNHTATPEELDSFLANSMARLDVQQRESILEELHGVRSSSDPESNPAVVNTWLQMLDMHLQNIKRGTLYEVAEAIDRDYVTSTSFRMKFLRATRYDPQQAAVQVLKFLEVKRSLFGHKKLTKRITLADLNEEDREFLASGAVQVSKKRDRSGREIVIFFPSLQREGTPIQAVLRARYYAIMSLLESEDTQKNGMILVYFGALPSTEPNHHRVTPGLLWDLPIFYSGIHCCLKELTAYALVSVAILRMPFNIRPRIRVHYGSCTDCLDKLSSFGIPRDAIVTDSDEPRLDEHWTWYRRRQDMELSYVTDSDADTPSVGSEMVGQIVPRPNDVLFGAGGRNNQGNLYLKKDGESNVDTAVWKISLSVGYLYKNLKTLYQTVPFGPRLLPLHPLYGIYLAAIATVALGD